MDGLTIGYGQGDVENVTNSNLRAHYLQNMQWVLITAALQKTGERRISLELTKMLRIWVFQWAK